jgi:hypothetical protein
MSAPVTKKDHGPKIRGEALYAADRPGKGILWGKFCRSTLPWAKIRGITIPPAGGLLRCGGRPAKKPKTPDPAAKISFSLVLPPQDFNPM